MANTPTSLCLQALALRILRGIEAKNFLEIGVGAGDFLVALGKKGFSGKGIDFSSEAVAETKSKLDKYGLKGIEVEQSDFMLIQGNFDLILAFEVIEHIEDDSRAFAKVYELLGPGGYMLMSVPAHMKVWGKSDVVFGHYRRYEKTDLINKISAAGFQVKDIWSAAYPVGNIMKRIRDIIQGRQFAKYNALKPEERSKHSGMDKVINAPDWIHNLLFNRLTVTPALIAQSFFIHTDLGATYIVKAQKN